MKHLLIIGARGFGREVFYMATASKGYGTDFDIKGYLDDKTDALDGYKGYPPILDSVEHYEPEQDDVFICALGDNKYKKKYADIVLAKNGQFINLIHKKSIILENVKMGIGCIVGYDVTISCDITVGDFVTFQQGAIIGHDAQIGSYCMVNTNSFMGGFSKLGNNTSLWTGSIVLPHVSIGNNCTVGAGSVVIKNVKDNTTVYGNPAKVLKF